jgi:DNA-binding SARP family transcriptional activator
MNPDPNENFGHLKLRVALFGEPRVLTQNDVEIRVKSQKAALLLAYLAHFNNRHHSREQLAEVLWPDSDGDSARARLRNVLSELRRVVEGAGVDPNAVITATRTSIEFTPGCVQTDVARFEGLLKEARNQDPDSAISLLKQAVDISSSELCTTLYDEWILLERPRLTNLRHATLARLASTLVDLGRLSEAEEAALILLREEPASEAAHNALIATHIAAGSYAAARRQYATLEHILLAEHGTPPSGTSKELIASIPLLNERTSNPGIIRKEEPVDNPAALPVSLPPQRGHSGPAALSDHHLSWGGTYGLAALALIAIGGWAAIVRKAEPHKDPPSIHAPTVSPVANSHNPVWSFRYTPAADEKDSEPSAVGGTPDGGMVVTGFVRTTHNDVDFLTFKLSADGKLMWRARYNGTGNDVDRARAVLVDGPGNIYVTGESDNGKGNGLSKLAGCDIVTVKYDKNGNQLWVQRLNGTGDGDDRPLEFAWAGGNYCVLGTVEAKVPGRLRPVAKPVVVAYSPEGNEVWRRLVDENTPDAVTAVSMTGADNGVLVVCGQVVAVAKSGAETDISVTYLTPQGHVISESRYGKGNGADDLPARIASNQRNESWVLGIGHTPDMPPASPRELMAVKYGMSGKFEWARPLGVGSDRVERISSTSGSRYQRQSLLTETSDDTGNRRFWLLTANADGTLAWAGIVAASEYELVEPRMGTEARLLCNGPGLATWVAVPVVNHPDKNGNGPNGVMTARYDAYGHQMWRDTYYGGAGEMVGARALGFGVSGVYMAGQWHSHVSAAIPPRTIVLKYHE